MELTIKDTKATAGTCNCGCGHEHAKSKEAAAAATCNCGADCTCGCQEGKPCTCGTAEGNVARYTVSGMTCAHCVSAVTEEVSSIPGVSSVAVDLDSGALTVGSDAPVDFDRIVEAVAEAGDYTVA